MNYDNAYVYGGTYDSADAARSDYDNLALLYADEVIGPFQAAMVEKRADGKVKVLDTTSTTRTTGAAVGAAIGAVLALIFPPAILLTAAGRRRRRCGCGRHLEGLDQRRREEARSSS